MERGQIVADRQDRESFLGRLMLSLADTARLLGVSTSEMVSGTFFTSCQKSGNT
jgi:hypothetical protein